MRSKTVLLLFCLGMLPGGPRGSQAQTVVFAGAGSSEMWQNFALAAYNSGNCVAGGLVWPTPPCSHYTGLNFLLHDNRTGTNDVIIGDEPGNIWIVWDSATPPNVWMYINVDSAVANRCYFGASSNFPHACTFTISTFPLPANLITLPGAIWGGIAADTMPPPSIQALFTGYWNPMTTAALTDVRPEDAMYANCRANSQLDTSNTKKGLGYNPYIPAGECPVFGLIAGNLIGDQIYSAFSAKSVQTVPFNIIPGGADPITGVPVTAGTVKMVGAEPIIFIFSRTRALSGLTNANCCNDTQLQTVYTGFNGGPTQNASALGQPAGAINVLQGEPLSGTMNTTEFDVFRNNPFPTAFSQEDGVNPPGDNPLEQSITGGGRYRVIGSGEMVSEIYIPTSPAAPTSDTLGYTFFNFGNIGQIADSSFYGYASLDGLNPIFTAGGGDPGDPGNSELPGAPFPAAAGCTGNTFPCAENQIWRSPGLSFPNVRACTASGNTGYRAWSVLRLITDGPENLVNAEALISGASAAAVSAVPDFVPFNAVTVNGFTDPGFACYRSHYQFEVTNTDGTTTTILPQNGLLGESPEAGRDEGGCQELQQPSLGPGLLNLGQEYAPDGVPNGCAFLTFP